MREFITCNFWTEKIEEYVSKNNRDIFDNGTSPDVKKILTDLYNAISTKYGTERIKVRKDKSYHYKKEYDYWTLFIFPVDKNKDPESYIVISHYFGPRESSYLYRISNYHCRYSFRFLTAKYEDLLDLVIKYIEEYPTNVNTLNQKLLENQKEEKIKSIAQQSIKTIVETKMAGTGYQWNLQEEETRCVLRIKMKRRKMIELTLGYKSFTEKIPEMLEVIKQMENLLETIPYPANIRSYGNNIEWKN